MVVKIIWASTIWGLFSCFLLFPHLGLPRRLQWAAMTLLSAELFTLGMYSYGGDAVAEVGRDGATLDVPLLSVALLALAIMRGWSAASEDPRHGLARQGRRRDHSRAQ
jgi:hypothetical protein